MPEAAIVDAIRTPIGRAFKGSLKDVRADELAAIPLRALQERNPDVDFAAFAAQIVPCGDELGIDPDKLNPFGGAIALGHPFGMTGARIMTTLLNGLQAKDATIGVESMCVAGGMGEAMVVERLD
jgi:acetyl-CoA C-acetyltransferase